MTIKLSAKQSYNTTTPNVLTGADWCGEWVISTEFLDGTTAQEIIPFDFSPTQSDAATIAQFANVGMTILAGQDLCNLEPVVIDEATVKEVKISLLVWDCNEPKPECDSGDGGYVTKTIKMCTKTQEVCLVYYDNGVPLKTGGQLDTLVVNGVEYVPTPIVVGSTPDIISIGAYSYDQAVLNDLNALGIPGIEFCPPTEADIDAQPAGSLGINGYDSSLQELMRVKKCVGTTFSMQFFGDTVFILTITESLVSNILTSTGDTSASWPVQLIETNEIPCSQA